MWGRHFWGLLGFDLKSLEDSSGAVFEREMESACELNKICEKLDECEIVLEVVPAKVFRHLVGRDEMKVRESRWSREGVRISAGFEDNIYETDILRRLVRAKF